MYLKHILLGWRFLFLIRTLAELKFHPSCILDGHFDLPSIIRKGDVDLGGIFSIHSIESHSDLDFRKAPDKLTCARFTLRNYQFIQLMIFAIEEINKNKELLPNVTLGYRIYDGCLNYFQAMRAALSMTTGIGHHVYNCNQLPLVPVIIGSSKSAQSIAVASIAGVFNMPMISYFSSCACLSRKHDYPTFLRTIPSDLFQFQALAQLIGHFKWSWIGIIAEGNAYGQDATAVFKESAIKLGICVAFTAVIQEVISPGIISKTIKSISLHKVKVVLIIVSEALSKIIFKEIIYQNLTGIQWIGSESWSTSDFSSEEFYSYFGGTIGSAIRTAKIPGLKSFLYNIHPSQQKNNPFISELWETMFNCSLKSDGNGTHLSKQSCSGHENVDAIKNIYLDVNNNGISYNVYKAVYAVAHALNNIITFYQINESFINRTPKSVFSFEPWKLLQVLKKVNFTTVAGDKVSFDENGDPDPSYDLVNWQKSTNGSVLPVYVGKFNKEDNFKIDEDLIVWQGSQKEIPISVCSESCPPGSRKAIQKGKYPCCFDCIPCDNGKVSNQSNSLECIKCPLEYWSNKPRDRCILKELEFISFKETLGAILFASALLGIFLTVFVIAIFLYHRQSPIVKANNSHLSFCILVSIALCFLSSITFLDKPTVLSCMMRHTGFGITFALCIACILGKTIVVLIAFNVQHPDRNISLFFSPMKQKSLTFLTTIFQVIVCATWNFISPPWPVKRITDETPTILLACDIGSLLAFSLVLGYIGVLVCICFTLAFYVRNLPYHYNEAQFITFSMVIFSAVWIAFIPSYLSSPGKYLEAVEMFAILCSSYGLLVCIFAPKCYIILLRPEKNDRKYMRNRSNS